MGAPTWAPWSWRVVSLPHCDPAESLRSRFRSQTDRISSTCRSLLRKKLAACLKLRLRGCLSPTASGPEVCRIVREAMLESRREVEQQGFTWASWETRLPSKLYGLLSEKGREMTEPFRWSKGARSSEAWQACSSWPPTLSSPRGVPSRSRPACLTSSCARRCFVALPSRSSPIPPKRLAGPSSPWSP